MSSTRNPISAPQPLPRNPTGMLALWFGIATVAVMATSQIVGQLLPWLMPHFDLNARSLTMLFAPFQILQLLFGTTALTAGIMGLKRPGLARGAAGAGTALGASALIGSLISLSAQLLRAVLI